MKRCILAVLIVLFFAAQYSACAQNISKNVQIQKLYATPDLNSDVVFNIPIDVRLVGLTDDKNWYKIKIGFNFLGYHEYIGWAKLN